MIGDMPVIGDNLLQRALHIKHIVEKRLDDPAQCRTAAAVPTIMKMNQFW